MIGYVVLGTNDLPRAKAFYDALLGEIGIKRMMEFGDRGYAWGVAMDKPALGIMKPFDEKPATVGNGVMAAIVVDSRDKVDRVYKKALDLGARAARASMPATSATSTATSSTCSAPAELHWVRVPADLSACSLAA
jgi:catechol 2,3-dioxygenase-like lactoylglutathione lyase family enzyme